MTLDDLVAFGCYVNAGFCDHYDGKKHIRLGEVLADGTLNFTGEGAALAHNFLVSKQLELATAPPDNAAELAAIAAKAEAEKAQNDATGITVDPVSLKRVDLAA